MYMYLPPPSLDHELPGQVGGRLGLQRSNDNSLVQWIPRNNLLMYYQREKGEREGGGGGGGGRGGGGKGVERGEKGGEKEGEETGNKTGWGKE